MNHSLCFYCYAFVIQSRGKAITLLLKFNIYITWIIQWLLYPGSWIEKCHDTAPHSARVVSKHEIRLYQCVSSLHHYLCGKCSFKHIIFLHHWYCHCRNYLLRAKGFSNYFENFLCREVRRSELLQIPLERWRVQYYPKNHISIRRKFHLLL